MPLAGALYAALAYGTWGVLPVYWKLLGGVPLAEVLAHRVLGTVLFTAALLGLLGQLPELRKALRSALERRALIASGLLIGVNWGVFIWAVGAGRIIETSLGYYLNPIVYATSVMAEILAGQMGFREDSIRKAELCGFFLEIGRKFLVIYNRKFAGEAGPLDDEFIETYHPYLADKIVSRYCLPEYVRTVLLARNLIMEENILSLAGIVHLAHDTVQASFRKNSNRLVMKCQVPRPGTDVTRTLESIMTEKFKAVGLENFLHVIRIPRIQDL